MSIKHKTKPVDKCEMESHEITVTHNCQGKFIIELGLNEALSILDLIGNLDREKLDYLGVGDSMSFIEALHYQMVNCNGKRR